MGSTTLIVGSTNVDVTGKDSAAAPPHRPRDTNRCSLTQPFTQPSATQNAAIQSLHPASGIKCRRKAAG